jgi:hypothetical protein
VYGKRYTLQGKRGERTVTAGSALRPHRGLKYGLKEQENEKDGMVGCGGIGWVCLGSG